MLAEDIEQVSQMSLDALCLQSAISLLDVGFAEQGEAEHTVSSSPFLVGNLKQRQRQLSTESVLPADTASRMTNIASTTLSLKLPLIALERSAAAYYPDIARLLGAELIVPPFSEVAGAVGGAAAGSVRQRVMILVTQPKDGVYRIHLPDGLQDRSDLEDALALPAPPPQKWPRAAPPPQGQARLKPPCQKRLTRYSSPQINRCFCKLRLPQMRPAPQHDGGDEALILGIAKKRK